MNFKDKHGLSTDAGFNAYAVLVPAMGVISSMPDGISRTILLGIVCLATAAVGWMTKGDKAEPIDTDSPIDDFLKRGRE